MSVMLFITGLRWLLQDSMTFHRGCISCGKSTQDISFAILHTNFTECFG